MIYILYNMGEKYCGNSSYIWIYLEPFFYCFVITKALNMSNAERKLVQLDQYPPRKNQSIHGTTIPILYKMGEKIVVILHIYGARAISYYFLITQTLNLSNEKQKLVYLYQYPPIRNIKGYMGQKYLYSTIREKNIVVLIHIYGARSIFLLFCDHQDTESESRKTETSISQTTPTHKMILKALWDNSFHTLQYGRKMLW